jgi:hypothetical protein
MNSSIKPTLVEVKSRKDFDSQSWRKIRDVKMREWIQDEWALKFVLDYSDAVELWDDLIDKDKEIDEQQVMRVFTNLLTAMPLNPFFNQHKSVFIPLIQASINAWFDSLNLEKGSDNDKAMAYMLRWYSHEAFIYTIFITRGYDYMRSVSLEVRRFFTGHESLDEYRRKL